MDINRNRSLSIKCWMLFGAHAAYGGRDKLIINFEIEVATELDGWKIAKRLLSFNLYKDHVFWVEPVTIGFTTAEAWLKSAGFGYDSATEKYKAIKHIGHTENYTDDGDADANSFMAGPWFVDPRHGGQGKKFPNVKTRWPFQQLWNSTPTCTPYRETLESFYDENPDAKHPTWVHPEWKNYPFDESDPNRPWN